MKKLLLVLTVGLLAAFSANAQWYVGGSLSIQPGAATDKDGNDALGLEIAPEVGYILNDKMAIGATLSYDNTFFGGGSIFSIAPYFRYFLLEMGPVSLFVDGQLELDFANMGGESQTGFGVGVAPGLSIPLNDHLSFVGHFAQVGYFLGNFVCDVNPANVRMGLYYAF